MLDSRYDHKNVEERIAKFWEENGIYSFDKDSSQEVFSVDTPPPTVSGTIHLGHVYSYSQADFIARYKRMRGYEVFYPFGLDDNGLPTELLVEKNHHVTAEGVGRENFVKLVGEEVKKYEEQYKVVWHRVGISVDWNLLYTTIGTKAQRVSQLSFVELTEAGRTYRKETPSIWCWKCRTTLSQMELEDKTFKSKFFKVKFSDDVIIATTRPELMPACVAVFVNPDDGKYKHLIGKQVKVPLYGQEVKIIGDRRVDPAKGTGIVMCCTFGDLTDIDWFKEYGLPLKTIMDDRGKMTYGKYAGKSILEARAAVAQDLRDAGLVLEEKDIEHDVNVHERCKTEIEFIVKKQWYIRYLDLKDEFLKLGGQLSWHPEYMKVRYDNWVNGLKWDWGISRQRYYGVPFPLWYCKDCGEPILADKRRLPVNPLTDSPEKPCPKCGSAAYVPETDIMDTWMTSSTTPLINSGWDGNKNYEGRVFPMSMRPQAHEIISMWLFTSIVKSYLHTGKLPFSHTLISGHGLDAKGHAMHKSLGNIVDPMPVMDKYGADALRHWASQAGLGSDGRYQEKDVVSGAKLVTKLWNVARFIDGVSEKATTAGAPNVVDRWILAKLAQATMKVTQHLEAFDYSSAKKEVDGFFWFFADNYVEFVKHRLYENGDAAAADTLKRVLLTVLKLYAPFMPYITEELYLKVFAAGETKSIHRSEWPSFDGEAVDEAALKSGDDLQRIIAFIRQWKHDNGMALNAPLESVSISRAVEGAEGAIGGAMKVSKVTVGEGSLNVPGTDIMVSIQKVG